MTLNFFHPILLLLFLTARVGGQQPVSEEEKPLYHLIEQYAEARDTKDTALLDRILTKDIDQLVSTGEWRRGLKTAKQGMMRSSTTNPGDRTLTVRNTRFLGPTTALIDARYTIKNRDGSLRNMWSTFVAVKENGNWKISAIRNMKPTGSD
ncbi:SgcJ/EcaC family oxidoreductase [Pseudozobellia thermophila]|uniref:SgcJ/EcaC family oxidoreductase n=1 Tax=Pseudozobellia thermophila TaxID=192903 RepID=UPI001BB0A9AC|nr:SgcJ/EcaC family oxidoreductase [Pseudozobellia thermophila]